MDAGCTKENLKFRCNISLITNQKIYQSNVLNSRHTSLNFYKLLILRTITLKFREYLDRNRFQTSHLTFAASEFMTLFLQCTETVT